MVHKAATISGSDDHWGISLRDLHDMPSLSPWRNIGRYLCTWKCSSISESMNSSSSISGYNYIVFYYVLYGYGGYISSEDIIIFYSLITQVDITWLVVSNIFDVPLYMG